jgi:hypothetical protein
MRELTKRRVLATVALAWVVLLPVIFVASCFLPGGTDRFLEESFCKLRPGMPRAEVEAILGPPGDYSSAPTIREEGPVPSPVPKPNPDISALADAADCFFVTWQHDTGHLEVRFFKDGTMVGASFWRCRKAAQGPGDWLLGRLKQLRRS